jgi:hypothetical protein
MCDKGFNNKQALDGHRNWHLNLKPHQCRQYIQLYFLLGATVKSVKMLIYVVANI